jgi:hypothetical protein
MTWWIGPLESAQPAEVVARGAAFASPVMSRTAKAQAVTGLRIDSNFHGLGSEWQVREVRVEVDVLCRPFISDLLGVKEWRQ